MASGQPGAGTRGVLGLLVAAVLSACAPTSTPGSGGDESVGEARSAAFLNGNFETGTNGSPPPSWTVTTELNPGVTIETPQTKAGLNLGPGGVALTTILTAASPESKTDPDLGSGATFRYPKFGTKCAVVNDTSSGKNKNANSLSQTMTVGAADVDPADGKIHIRFVVAPVLENPSHALAEQPYFFVQLTNVTKGNAVLYQDFNFSAQPGVPWKSASSIYYTDWQLVDIAPGPGALAQGDQVTLEIIGAGCSLGGHWGRVYVDGIGTTVPGLFVSATGPAAASAGTDITYTFHYKNGAATGASGVKVDFNTPPSTTYASINAPGLTCTTPASGAAGLVSCTIGSLAAAAFGSFEVTVHIGAAATGSVVNGNYAISGTGISPLLGSKVTTLIGCLADADCASGLWCNESLQACAATLANGTVIPSDPPHSNPTLASTCTAAAAALVCTSGVCDAGDDKCGYLNGTGPCSAANAAVVCRSAACDPDDGKCGYDIDNGPCTAANAAVVCRSGACGANGLCMPSGGCNTDADCTGGMWCHESIHTCAAKLANGTVIPSDPPHSNPTLASDCTAAAATLVCVSSVCDAGDDKCGYLNGTGPCSAANAAVVCRSAVCDASDGKCGYLNGTGPCTAANAAVACRSAVCGASDGKCGYLNGTGPCTAANAAVVCRSSVCDPDDGKCGFDIDNGPCTAANAAVVCRSGACGANGLCMPSGGCNTDADCTDGMWCHEAIHTCAPKLPNGTVIPSDPPHLNPALASTCTAAAATLVCVSSVCDVGDDKCGYLNGTGPCTAATASTVCRSAACDPDDGKCGYDIDNGPCTAATASTVCRSGTCGDNGLCMPSGGCNTDADCTGGTWCHEAIHTCAPKLPNGTQIPSDPPHTNPTLASICTAPAASLVCTSSVCDASDDKCGYLNGTGPCTAATASSVCRSGACDPDDSKCGYDIDNGPCTAATASTVCRSGACGANGLCMPSGGCNTDADCTGGTWCHESIHTCAAKLANGTLIPSDPPHTNPTLASICTAPAASLVCTSSVCDASDDKCGYLNGTGPCTAATASTVCRSAACDPDDGKCGYDINNGPCTAATASTVCRSGACGANGLCMPSGGCNTDADCTGGMWCHEAIHTCAPKLPNGTVIPSDPPHSNPTLASTCTAPAASLVCTSSVCDASDDKCGYLNGTGPCTAASASTVCRSGACDPDDGKCGYDIDNGPCTAATASTVCRSGACGANGLCMPSGGCNTDADCAGGMWCHEAIHTCAPKLPNGTVIPSDPPHSNPTLASTCTAPAASLVCTSSVCDASDDKCGYLNGTGPCTAATASTVCRSAACDPDDGKCGYDIDNGPCTAATASTVCRSGACGANGLCMPSGGCNTDADCTGGMWCHEAIHTCAPKLPNGTQIPSDPPHTNPTLASTCTAAAATLVCTSSVCDASDDKCGYLNGTGPCTAVTASTVCRSAACDPDDGKCGYDIDNGPCAAATASTVCRSGACGANGLCMPSGGCNTDADCTGGMWCHEAIHTCAPKLPNGTVIPSDPPHSNPALASTCTAAAATLVCVSSVCDVGDDKCGYLNGTGPCTAATAATVCRSGACDPDDGKCGYDIDNGPCTVATASTVCRSGACGANGLCMPSGGCNTDADCTGGMWCHEAIHTCAPKLPNGTVIPSDPPHSNPTLASTCTAPAASLVCTSSVCDASDDKCGYLNGTGPCTAATASTVCRSAACDPDDGKCGYDIDNGPCTAATASTVCRSGACGANGLCMPSGGCNTDADCTGGTWCHESIHTCAAKLANGTLIPSDPPHTNPTLASICTAPAASLVCTSSVCDASDDKCGYLNGTGPCTAATASTVCRSGACDPDDSKCGYDIDNGPCTAATASTVCRSGACGANGLCMPSGGCNTDADCSAGTWCNESLHSCAPKLPNGTQIPSDPPHTNPTLASTCTAPAASLVCTSSVCDASDDKCGYLNGTGPCTAATASTVCRSGACDPDDSKCGYDIDNGPCTAATASTVCRSGACGANGLCMPSGGCNTDADCSAGTWCNESLHSCAPKLPNGTQIPSDPPHTNPTLASTCTAPAASLVCASSVCDASDDACGYLNGTGPCKALDAAVVCRSAACDPNDSLCGYADGAGPCTAANASTVCRSGICSPNGAICIPEGGCGVDADCAPTHWCNTGKLACDPKIPNGQLLPTVPDHTPSLTGTCTPAAASAVCVSAVCDPQDDQCGFLNGTGPCTLADAALVCRSGACSANGLCMPSSGCNTDADCSGGAWCNLSAHLCAPKIANGGALPSDPPHANPTLDGSCSEDAAALVCASSVCDTADDKCGFANGHGACDAALAEIVCRSGACDPDGQCGYADGDGPCSQGDASVVCRSGACSANGAVCVPPGGCAVDSDCGPSEWCDTPAFTCTPKLPNGTLVPAVPGHDPALSGKCTPEAAASVCASGVCDTSDDKCGYADGDGPCTDANATVVCRSGSCDSADLCAAPGSCNVDADCDTLSHYCDTGEHLCAPKLPNGAPLPSIPGHQPPLDGTCDAASSSIVCLAAVCDADDRCGYSDGTGPCTLEDAGVVCRSSTCSPNGGVCIPSGGCGVDADCASAEWCDTGSFICTPKLPNGTLIPTVPGHTPALAGTCTPETGASVCWSAVCDASDDKCGYAFGSGPCTPATAGVVCRTGACSAAGVCVQPSGCIVDADCNVAVAYCDTGAHQCAPKLPNGEPLPVVPGHSPALDGSCTDASAPVVCLSGVCDAADDRCGHANGNGPCDAEDGAVVCRSATCAASGANEGLCVECTDDGPCEGAQPVCDTDTNLCVQCTPGDAGACAGATPICAAPEDTCAPCDGDLGSEAPLACAEPGAPYCFLAGPAKGECGKCATNEDCAGHPGGPFCDAATGACGVLCHADEDCQSEEWCDAPAGGAGACVPKLENGTHLPSAPEGVVSCTPEVGARVCLSGACDPADDACGYQNAHGPCEDAAVCRSGACDAADGLCGLQPGNGPCAEDAACRVTVCDAAAGLCAPLCQADSDCPQDAFCKSDGECVAKLDDGSTCDSASQCLSTTCAAGVCAPQDHTIPVGSGLFCALLPASPAAPSQDRGALFLGLLLGAAGLARRLRRPR